MIHIIEAIILSGCNKREDRFIPIIYSVPINLEFEFKILQFPKRPDAFMDESMLTFWKSE